MTDDAIGSFEAHAPEYNALRRKLIPPFDRFYRAASEAVGFAGNQPRRILDLGAGTGLLTSWLADRWPDASFVIQDGSPAMLEQAAELLGARIESAVVSDLTDPLPPGPFDAVASSLAIHHLEDDAKRDLFARVLDELRPGGWFVNAEQVAGPTPALNAEFEAWHAAETRRLGVTEDEWAAALQRFKHDRRASVHDQMKWLIQAGFADVECLLQEYCFAVLIGRSPG